MSSPCVLDASAALSLLVASQATSASAEFFVDPSHEWVAPGLFRIEVRNALHRIVRRGSLDASDSDRDLRLLESGMRFEPAEDTVLLGRIVARARDVGLSVYDATYLETASRLDASIASRDAALLDACATVDIVVHDLR